jgi:hypothetical protein
MLTQPWMRSALPVFLVTSMMDPATASQDKVFPAEARGKIAGPAYRNVIVLSSSPTGDPAFEAALRRHTVPAFEGGLEKARLPLIGGYAVRANAQGIQGLAQVPEVVALWVTPDQLFGDSVRIIKSIDYVVRTVPQPMAINISLGPPPAMLPLPYREREPVSLAIQKAGEADKLVVMSAGNAGPKDDTLNPWCLSPTVVCVGAATEDGSGLWKQSSRGRPGDPLYRPSVVAPGVDVITTHPPGIPKSAEMLAAEKWAGFDQRVPPDKRHLYTVVSGSSFAASHVSDAAAQVFFYLSKAREELAAQGDKDPKIAMIYTHASLQKRDALVRTRRLAGEVKDFDSNFLAIYPARPDPLVVKQILLDSALPMAGYREHEVGSGFLHQEIINRLFGQYGLVQPKILSTKAVE